MFNQQDDEGPAPVGHNSGEARTRMLETEITKAVASLKPRDKFEAREDVKPLLTAASAMVEFKFTRAYKTLNITLSNDRARVTSRHRAVLDWITYFINRTTYGYAWPGYRLLAALTGMQVKSVRDACHQLANWGYLVRTSARLLNPHGKVGAAFALAPGFLPSDSAKAPAVMREWADAEAALDQQVKTAQARLKEERKARRAARASAIDGVGPDAIDEDDDGVDTDAIDDENAETMASPPTPSIETMASHPTPSSAIDGVSANAVYMNQGILNQGNKTERGEKAASDKRASGPSDEGLVEGAAAENATPAERAPAASDPSFRQVALARAPVPPPPIPAPLGTALATPTALNGEVLAPGDAFRLDAGMGSAWGSAISVEVPGKKPLRATRGEVMSAAAATGYPVELAMETAASVLQGLAERDKFWRPPVMQAYLMEQFTKAAGDIRAAQTAAKSRMAKAEARAHADAIALPGNGGAPRRFAANGKPRSPKFKSTDADTANSILAIADGWRKEAGPLVDITDWNAIAENFDTEKHGEKWQEHLATEILRRAIQRILRPAPEGLAAELQATSPEIPLSVVETAVARAYAAPWIYFRHWARYTPEKSPAEYADEIRAAWPHAIEQWRKDQIAATRAAIYAYPNGYAAKGPILLSAIEVMEALSQGEKLFTVCSLDAPYSTNQAVHDRNWDGTGLGARVAEMQAERVGDLIDAIREHCVAFLAKRAPDAVFVWEPELPTPPVPLRVAFNAPKPEPARDGRSRIVRPKII